MRPRRLTHSSAGTRHARGQGELRTPDAWLARPALTAAVFDQGSVDGWPARFLESLVESRSVFAPVRECV
jgi:hypothetical protein